MRQVRDRIATDRRQVRDGFASELRKNYDSNQTSEEQL